MSIRTETRQIEVKIYGCDFCDKEVDEGNNRGCCGTAPIKWCDFCEGEKACCSKHRRQYWENDWNDYPDFTACADCMDKVDKCVEIAREVAGRYDFWPDVVKRIYRNFEEYEDYLDDDEPTIAELNELFEVREGKSRAAKTVKSKPLSPEELDKLREDLYEE